MPDMTKDNSHSMSLKSTASRRKKTCVDILGKAFAGNGRLSNGQTLADKKPGKYDNPLTDYVNLVIAEIKARHAN